MPIAPKSTNEVFVACGCGAMANELAYRTAFSNFHKHNPEAKNLEIISFDKGFHGRLFHTLSTTRTNPYYRIGIPVHNWRHAIFPSIKFPYYLHEASNAAQEQSSLSHLDSLFSSGNIAAVVIEPVIAEGGDKLASPNFYLGVQEIARRHGALFIVDEVQTGGGATGRFWAHEHWGPRADPDIVTFAKKLQVSGFYYKSNLRTTEEELLFNPSNSDHMRIFNLRTLWNVIQTDNLLKRVESVGMALQTGLRRLEEKYQISNVRGYGTFLAYDLPSNEITKKLIERMKKAGVIMGICGERSIRLRPSLIFEEKHAEIYLERLEIALQGISN